MEVATAGVAGTAVAETAPVEIAGCYYTPPSLVVVDDDAAQSADGDSNNSDPRTARDGDWPDCDDVRGEEDGSAT